MPKVIVYSSAFCPYCVRAKNLLDVKGVKYDEIRVDLDPPKMQEMVERSQRRTVPQIFIDDFHVGGFTDLAALERDKRLDELLKTEAA